MSNKEERELAKKEKEEQLNLEVKEAQKFIRLYNSVRDGDSAAESIRRKQDMVNEAIRNADVLKLRYIDFYTYLQNITEPDTKKYKELKILLSILRGDILLKLKAKQESGIPLSHSETDMIFRMIDAIEKYNKIIYGSKSINVKLDYKQIHDAYSQKKKKKMIIGDDNEREGISVEYTEDQENESSD